VCRQPCRCAAPRELSSDVRGTLHSTAARPTGGADGVVVGDRADIYLEIEAVLNP
jgi:hypothetical protein